MRPAGVALVVAVAAAALVGTATLVGPPDSVVADHPGVAEPVVRSSLVCPFVGGEGARAAQVGVLALPDVGDASTAEPAPATVTALASMPEPDAAPDGEATATAEPTQPPKPEPIMSVTARGVPTIADVDTEKGTSFVVEASNALAPGLAAEQSLIASASDLHGLSTTPCTTATREHWFVGGSGQVGSRGRVILANPTDVPAVADVTLWDEAGPIDAPATQDIGVAARSQRVLLLDALAPESAQVGVQVTTSQGRVSVALEVRETSEITPQGMTYIPEAVAPGSKVVVPGVPGHGERLLRILAPGDVDAIVSMRLLGPGGPFSAVDQEVLTVPAGSVLEVPLDSVGEQAVAVELDSDQPVTAAVRVVDRPEDALPDLAYSAASEPLDGPAAALLGRAGDTMAGNLWLSSVAESGARVVVRTLGPDGAVVAEAPVDIPGGTTMPIALGIPEGATWATVVVEPETPGAVVAAREMVGSDDGDAMLDLMPLNSPAVTVQVPDVVGELPEVPDPDESG